MRKGWLILLVLFVGCSDQKGGDTGDTGTPPPRLLIPDAEVEADVRVLPYDVIDSGVPDSANPTHPGIDPYQQTCWQTQLWFCPESFHGNDQALYRIEVIVDICDENGDPCIPEVPPTEACTWSVISQGECEEAFECNPDPNLCLLNTSPSPRDS